MVIWEANAITLREETPRRKNRHDSDSVNDTDDHFYGSPCAFLSPSRLANESTARRINHSLNDIQDTKAICEDALNPLNMLPDDILSECFFGGYLEQREAVQLSCVSKQMRRLTFRSIRSLDLSKRKLCPTDIGNIVSRFTMLSTLDFSDSSQFTGDCLLKLVPLSKTLRSLRLCGACITDSDVDSYFSKVEQYLGGPSLIEVLDLHARGSECMRNEIGDLSVLKISMCCPSLQKLRLGWCNNVSDCSVHSLQKLGQLRELDLSMTGVSSVSCRSLSKMKSLTNLYLDSSKVDDSGIRVLIKRSHRSSLKSLSIRSIDVSLKTLQTLARRASEMKTNLELSICTNLGVRADFVLDQMTRNDSAALDGYIQNNAEQLSNSVWDP